MLSNSKEYFQLFNDSFKCAINYCFVNFGINIRPRPQKSSTPAEIEFILDLFCKDEILGVQGTKIMKNIGKIRVAKSNTTFKVISSPSISDLDKIIEDRNNISQFEWQTNPY